MLGIGGCSFYVNQWYARRDKRWQLIVRCMADQSIHLLGEAPLAAGESRCKGPPKPPKADIHVYVTAYPNHQHHFAHLKDHPTTLLFLHRLSAGSYQGWTNTVLLTNLGRCAQPLTLIVIITLRPTKSPSTVGNGNRK